MNQTVRVLKSVIDQEYEKLFDKVEQEIKDNVFCEESDIQDFERTIEDNKLSHKLVYTHKDVRDHLVFKCTVSVENFKMGFSKDIWHDRITDKQASSFHDVSSKVKILMNKLTK